MIDIWLLLIEILKLVRLINVCFRANFAFYALAKWVIKVKNYEAIRRNYYWFRHCVAQFHTADQTTQFLHNNLPFMWYKTFIMSNWLQRSPDITISYTLIYIIYIIYHKPITTIWDNGVSPRIALPYSALFVNVYLVGNRYK